MADEVLGKPNVCIYCGGTEDLSTEHIIPFGINGTWVLQKASCPVCRKITGKIENNVLRGFLLPARTALRVRTRHKKNKRPNELPIILKKGAEKIVTTMPLADLPVTLLSPIFEKPRFLKDRVSDKQQGIAMIAFHTFRVGGKSPGEFFNENRAKGVTEFSIPTEGKFADFAAMLAKIALGYTVAKIGIENIRSNYVAPLILGKSIDLGKFVGTISQRSVEQVKDVLHNVRMDVWSDGIICCQIHLFAKYNTPVYLVVVGEAAQTYMEKINSRAI